MIIRTRPTSIFAVLILVSLYAHAGGGNPDQVLFGDTHLHTENSGDAFMSGNRLSPEQAYRFARGESVTLATGPTIQLARPLDFLVVTDHAEGLGLSRELASGNATLAVDETVARWMTMMRQGGAAAQDAKNELVAAQATGNLPPGLKDPAIVGPVMRSVWHRYTETAETFNQPGTFSTLIGYEWSSVPGGNNLHRNVVYRGSKAQADQMLPFSSWQSDDPQRLWQWMARYESKTGDQLIAIPHNANLSNGAMFAPTERSGKAIDRDYAATRSHYETLQEIVQIKGNSETHPTLSPDDAFAGDMGVVGWDLGNLSLTGEAETPAMRQTGYVRAGLLRGLEHQARLGANPFKFGLIGSSDSHVSASSIEENNFAGKDVFSEPAAGRWALLNRETPVGARYVWHYLAAGYAAVWARENSRGAIWDALKRREAYATSGTRITLRVFGGWDFDPSDADDPELASVGYGKGVPMGSDLPHPAGGRAPSFLISAMKDPLFANLERIQIVKGWLDPNGEAQERVYDVKTSSSTCAEGEATDSCEPGDPAMTAVWVDPDFNAKQPAFYYTRVLEVPSPNWIGHDIERHGGQPDPDIPLVVQERAWSSPIWYTPE